MLTTTSLAERYAALKQDNPRIRIRDAAQKLDVSEMTLLELGLGENVTRLEGGWPALLQEIKALGKVMALTRNDFVVHERKGVYNNVSFVHDGRIGLAVNPDIDLRLFMSEWRYGYAVRMQAGKRDLRSFQFFNAAGLAIHKIYLTPESDVDAYADLVAKYRHPVQTGQTEVARPEPQPAKPVFIENFDQVEAFRQEWRDLKDTHDFFPLLKKYELPRLQALRLAPEGYAQKIDNGAVARLFEMAAEREIPIMVFVGNSGCIQIHTGTVRRLAPMEGWFNVMDPDFNLHLKLEGVSETWITRKPTVDGLVTGLEVYADNGELIVQCFGKRKPGIAELGAWRVLVTDLVEQ